MAEWLLLLVLADGTHVHACEVDDHATRVECTRSRGTAVDCPYLAPRMIEAAADRIPLCPMGDGDSMALVNGRWVRLEGSAPHVAAGPTQPR